VSKLSRKYDRIEFTKEMKNEYTILCPDMAPIHFGILEKIFRLHGYNLVVLKNEGSSVVDEGLRMVHNDTCYPALLVIGQMLDALNSGNYDTDKVALMITQTGGGCRASNYIYLLRKALKKSGYENVPVISLNAGGLEKNSGFKITYKMLMQLVAAVAYGDLLMLLNNQVKPYEINKGQSQELVNTWIDEIGNRFEKNDAWGLKNIQNVSKEIAQSFSKIPVNRTNKVKVGIVGEIYVKFSSLGNNRLEEFLHEEDCEIMVPSLMGFLMYCVENGVIDYSLYGGSWLKSKTMSFINGYLSKVEEATSDAVRSVGNFVVPSPFMHTKEIVDGIVGLGCKMGEGWLLPAEMVELINLGYENIVVAQPFGCLPNHIVGKGVISNIKKKYPNANIVPIDYDPSATKVNQENRIKLMLSVAKEKINEPEIKESINFEKSKELILQK